MREHLRECNSGRWGKSQNVGCGAQRFFVDMYLQQAVPATADPRKWSLQPIVLQHPHTQSMDEYWDSTEIMK